MTIKTSKHEKKGHTSTPYDDVHRTLINDCPGLMIPLVNEMFHRNHALGENVNVLNNELFLNRQDGIQLERITDSNLKIEDQRYHIECQSKEDGTILVRIFEYDSQIALQDSILEGNTLYVKFPNAAVIYLRHKKSTPSYMSIHIEVPGDECCYQVPVLKAQNYTVEEIFRKKLYYLIPFHIFVFEQGFQMYEKEEAKRQELLQEYNSIMKGLEQETTKGNMTEYIRCTLVDMSKKVLLHIADRYATVKESVGEIMGGQILDYEAKDILNKGIKLGLEESLRHMVSKKWEKGQTIAQIAEDLLEEEETIRGLVEDLTKER